MNTAPVSARVLGGMCMDDNFANPEIHASIDLNGDFTKAGYRTTRKGTRPLWSNLDRIFDVRGVHIYRAFTGELRVINICETTDTDTRSVAGNTVKFAEGELVLFVFDIDNPTWGPIAYSKVGVLVNPSGDVLTAPYTTESHPWTANFYVQRRLLFIAGHPEFLFQIDYDALRAGSIEDNYPSTPIAPRTGFFNVYPSYFSNTTGLDGSYVTGMFVPSRMSRIDNQAFYSFKRPTYATLDNALDSQQDVVPNWRVNAGRTTIQLDDRVFMWSDTEEPTIVYGLDFLVGDNGKPIVDVRQAGTRWAIITETSVTFRPSLAFYNPANQDPAYIGAEVSQGTPAAASIIELDGSLVFVNHGGIVVASPEGAKTVSSPFLDALFHGTMRSTLPIQLSTMARRCGLPYQIDHRRLEQATATLDESRNLYIVAVTTNGSKVINDLLILWDYKENRFTLHHQMVLDEDLKGYDLFDNPYIPSISWACVDTAYRTDGSSVTVIGNELGTFVMWDGDGDFEKRKAASGRRFTPSIRTSATFMKDDYAEKAAQEINVMLRSNVFESSGIATFYIDGEGSSTETKTTKDLTGEMPFTKTKAFSIAEQAVPEGSVWWGKLGELWSSSTTSGTGRVWARPDYQNVEIKAPLRSMRWWRLTQYDTIGEVYNQAREMEVVGFSVEVGRVKK